MTNEGEEFQAGLWCAGWTAVGRGYDELQDVREILDRYRPELIVTNDKRDWDPESPISFDKSVGFHGIHHLRGYTDGLTFINVKDAGSMPEYHAQYFHETGAAGIIVYYHEHNVRKVARWIPSDARLIRTYHSVNKDRIAKINLHQPRKRCLVSGATSSLFYPLRVTARGAQRFIGLDNLPHPRHGMRGSQTETYLQKIAQYKVHIATASKLGFALRKIIESVAVGTTPITNLPEHDVLPEIDGALVRVPTTSSVTGLRVAVDLAERSWNLEERLEWARKAAEYYDFRAVGMRLSENLIAFARRRHDQQAGRLRAVAE